MTKKFYYFCLPFIAPLALLGIWALVATSIDNSVILPRINEVLTILIHPLDDLIGMGSLLTNVCVSLVRVMMGYILAACIAIPLGLFMGYYAIASKFLHGVVSIFRPIPPLAWVPLVMAWFGVASFATLLGVEMGWIYIWLNNLKFSMLFIIFVGAFYPILTSTIHGVRNVPTTLIHSSRVLGATEYQIFTKVLLPASMPAIMNGMRIGLGIAWMCLVSAEMLPGSLAGIGYMITHAFTLASTDVVIAGMVSIGLIGAILDYGFRRVEKTLFAWQKEVQQ